MADEDAQEPVQASEAGSIPPPVVPPPQTEPSAAAAAPQEGILQPWEMDSFSERVHALITGGTDGLDSDEVATLRSIEEANNKIAELARKADLYEATIKDIWGDLEAVKSEREACVKKLWEQEQAKPS